VKESLAKHHNKSFFVTLQHHHSSILFGFTLVRPNGLCWGQISSFAHNWGQIFLLPGRAHKEVAIKTWRLTPRSPMRYGAWN